MIEKNYDKKNYSAADIERYLSGNMPAPEMNALEKAALDDPFLQDALEGYALLDAEANRRNWAELQQRLTQRTRLKIIQSGWWKMAAAVLLLAGGASLAYMLIVKKPSQQIAMRKSDSKPEKIMPGSTANREPRLTDTLLPLAPQESTGMKAVPPPAILRQEKEEASFSRPGSAKPEAAERKPAALATTIRGRGKNPRTPDTVLAAALNANRLAKNAPLKEEKVRDTFRFAAPATTRKIPGDTPQIAPVRTEPSAAGLEKALAGRVSGLKVPPGKPVPDGALEEVVVSGYARQRKKAVTVAAAVKVAVTRKDTIMAPDAEPVAGNSAYLKYLAENKPASETENTAPRNAIVSFTVTPRGKLTRFKMEESVSPFIDQELIRLIKEGPVWRTLGNKRERVKIVITY